MAIALGNLQIDLTDPKSIRKQVPRIEEMVESKAREATKAQEDLETWKALLGKLKNLAGMVLRIEEPRGPQPAAPSPAALDAVVQIVEREERPIMAIGVGEALSEEGHEVESPAAVEVILKAATATGRIQEVGSRIFAPLSVDTTLLQAIPAMQAIPEAHLGLEGPPPQSKAEAAIRVLASDPHRLWTTPEIGQAMITRGWMSGADGDSASLASTLSRLVAEGKIHRPRRGQYQLAPPGEEEGEE